MDENNISEVAMDENNTAEEAMPEPMPNNVPDDSMSSMDDCSEADTTCVENKTEPDQSEQTDDHAPSSKDEESVENEVYNMAEDAENAPNLDADVDEVGDKAPKRPLAVITIDDSDSDDSSICHVESYQATASEAKKLRKGYSSSDLSDQSSSALSSIESESDSECDFSDIIYSMPSKLSSYEIIPKKTLSLDDIKLNECFQSDELNDEFLSHWTKAEPFTSESITLYSEPFQICIVDEFLNDVDVINNIVEDMNTLDWYRKTMDLYEFHRTADLCEISWQRSIKAVYELLKNDVMKWVARITNSNLTHVSASCALYGPGDHLLLHDDMLEDRKIAFILYLAPWNLPLKSREDEEAVSEDATNGPTPTNLSKVDDGNRKEKGWSKEMGGALEFFSTDDKGQPSLATKSLLPCNNTFAFFKVNERSFHQVAEVMTFDFPRLTINGWFHGPTEDKEGETKSKEKSPEVNTSHKPNNNVFQHDLNQWIDPMYLMPKYKHQILQHFEKTPETSLLGYFVQKQYADVVNVLQNDAVSWENCGPLNLRNYQMLPVNKISDESMSPLKNVIDIITSKHFINLLKDYTGYPILSYCKLEVQKWSAGSYTVIPTKEEYSVSEIDVTIYLGSSEKQSKGGIITYLSPEEADSEPFISIDPQNNVLNVVHSDAGIAKFTKYMSKLSFRRGEHHYAIVCSYRNAEPPN